MTHDGLDRVARELASGEISRRSALRRLLGVGLGLGAVVAPAGVAEAMGGGCPPGRKKCGKRCCPKNARCVNGKCKCKSGFDKCGKKCVDTDTSVKHCGACDHGCEPGQTCVAGECAECSSPDECPVPSDLCQDAVCNDGTCGAQDRPGIGAGCLCNDQMSQGVITCDSGTGEITCSGCPR